MSALDRTFWIPLLSPHEGMLSEAGLSVGSSTSSVSGDVDEDPGAWEARKERGRGRERERERGAEGVDYVTVTVHEPSMTADNFGLKTWVFIHAGEEVGNAQINTRNEST